MVRVRLGRRSMVRSTASKALGWLDTWHLFMLQKTSGEKVMANVYHVYIENHNAPGNGRYLYIVTDTLQNALAVGKAQCNNNEEVNSVDLSSRDVIIDYAAVGSAQH